MAPSFDCVASSLLCAEDNAIFGEDEVGGALMDDSEVTTETWSHRSSSQSSLGETSHGGDGVVEVLPLQSEELLASMAERECHHLPASDYLKRLVNGDIDLVARTQAVDWMLKANAHFGFGPLCSYLSINYLDRFLSAYELPSGKSWTMQLLAVACVSLAAKMEETEVPLCLDLQVGETKFVFEARTIQRMEMLVLSTLKWRMQSVTPFNFIDHYLNQLLNDLDHHHLQLQIIPLIQTSTQIILTTLQGIEMLEFKPSEIAAAVALLCVPKPNTFHSSKFHQIERVLKCVEVIKDTPTGIGSSGLTRRPIGVLEGSGCMSYKSDETCGIASSNERDNKRRKLNRHVQVEL